MNGYPRGEEEKLKFAFAFSWSRDDKIYKSFLCILIYYIYRLIKLNFLLFDNWKEKEIAESDFIHQNLDVWE